MDMNHEVTHYIYSVFSGHLIHVLHLKLLPVDVPQPLPYSQIDSPCPLPWSQQSCFDGPGASSLELSSKDSVSELFKLIVRREAINFPC